MFGEPTALQSPRQPLPEKHILLVEDEAIFREILTYFLRGKGYVVDAVGSAGAAITCLESARYALVISDWLLPDGNGVDVADAWRKDSDRQRPFCSVCRAVRPCAMNCC